MTEGVKARDSSSAMRAVSVKRRAGCFGLRRESRRPQSGVSRQELDGLRPDATGPLEPHRISHGGRGEIGGHRIARAASWSATAKSSGWETVRSENAPLERQLRDSIFEKPEVIRICSSESADDCGGQNPVIGRAGIERKGSCRARRIGVRLWLYGEEIALGATRVNRAIARTRSSVLAVTVDHRR